MRRPLRPCCGPCLLITPRWPPSVHFAREIVTEYSFSIRAAAVSATTGVEALGLQVLLSAVILQCKAGRVYRDGLLMLS